MTRKEIKKLTKGQIMQAIADIGDHPLAERFIDELNSRKAVTT